MVRLLTPSEELQRLGDRSVNLVTDRVQELVLAQRSQNPQVRQRALSRFADLLRRTQALSDLLGRRRAFLEIDSAVARFPRLREVLARGEGGRLALQASRPPGLRYADESVLPAPPPPGEPTPAIPNVPFQKAVEDLVRREPRLAQSAELVADVYSREHGFALARAANEAVTTKVQNVLQEFFEGLPRAEAIERISETALLQGTAKFSRAYAETVFRTNLNTAFTAGRFQQATEPGVDQAMPAFGYVPVRDSRVRRGRKVDEYVRGQAEDHLALDRMVAATGSSVWQIFAPPNGYNCRCSLRMKSIFELRREGVIKQLDDPVPDPSGLDPAWVHPNFRNGRPDQAIYFGVTA